MITTRSREGLTFVHDGDPEGGKLHIVIDPSKIKVEVETTAGTSYVTVTVDYNDIRDFVLDKLRRREQEKIEKMNGDELSAYFTGDWVKLDELQGR
jgi:hypothetical protein